MQADQRARQPRTVLLLCRHGQTAANVRGVLQGQQDTHLNSTGEAQAEALGVHLSQRERQLPLAPCVCAPPRESTPAEKRRLRRRGSTHPFPRRYSSDLLRASATARAVSRHCAGSEASALEVRTDRRLRERKLGPFEGLSEADAVRERGEQWRSFLRGGRGEGIETVGELGCRALEVSIRAQECAGRDSKDERAAACICAGAP